MTHRIPRLQLMYYHGKSSAPFSLGGEPIYNGILRRGNALYFKLNNNNASCANFVIGSYTKRDFTSDRITVQIGSFPTENVAELSPIIVTVDCIWARKHSPQYNRVQVIINKTSYNSKYYCTPIVTPLCRGHLCVPCNIL